MAPDRETLTRAAALVDLGLETCDRYGLQDLAAGLLASKRSLAAPAVHVVVVGDFKRGKSSLVNALVGAHVCPTDDAAATAIPIYVRYGSRLSAALIREAAGAGREPIDTADIASYALETQDTTTDSRTAAADSRTAAIEVTIPSDLLAGGLTIIDTPGVGGLGSTHAAATLAATAMADAVVFVTDAEQELTRTELDFLRHARGLCDTVICVLAKTDFYPAWRKVRDRDDQLAGVPLLPVSSPLRLHAVEAGDPLLDAESGFPDLIDLLRSRVEAAATRRLAAAATAEVVAVCDLIAGQFEAEATALADPGGPTEPAEPTSHRHALDASIAALAAALRNDLRTRIDRVITEADEAIDAGDPADTWAQMTSWLQVRISAELIENYTLLVARADAVAVGNGTHELSDFSAGDGATAGRMPAMAALRETYGGALPFALLGGLAGVALEPITVGITLVMGQTGLRDEKERQQYDRRSQAKRAVRRYGDEVISVMTAAAHDMLHRIQHRRTVRAAQVQQSISYARSAIAQAAQRTDAQRASRLSDIETELARLRELRDRAARA